VVEKNQLEAALAELIATLGTMPGKAIAAIKSEFRHSVSATLSDQLALEAEMVGDCAATETFEQRIEAFFTR